MISFIILYAVNFVRTLLIIAIVYFGIRLFTRYIMPLLIAKGVNKMQEKMQNQQRQNRPSRPEGEVTIEKDRTNNKRSSAPNEEYVDFEEVE